MMNKRKVTAIMISATLASVTLAGNVMAQNEYPTIDFNNTTVYKIKNKFLKYCYFRLRRRQRTEAK